ncbi:12727_t:CDS:2 [Rhizophagus irregularis]|nr:12727_t:CDS:2 [Rhizophagus irregularis]
MFRVKLTCSTSIDPSYFYGLSRICQKIQRLIIINTIPKANHGIVKLIEVQKNLKYFEWEDDFDEIFFIDPYEDIFMALTKRADTLNHLKVIFQFIDDYEHTFLQKVLPELHNLRTLKIDDLTLSNESSLKKLFYRDLEIFKIDYIEIQTATCIVENSGGYLRKILLKYCSYDNFNEDSLVLIRTIYKNCPLIEDLSLVFSSSELLKILIRSAPNNLREIRFFDNFKISLESLGSFLEGWRGRPSLSILTSDPVYEGENYINLVKKYKDDGVIKDFRREI